MRTAIIPWLLLPLLVGGRWRAGAVLPEGDDDELRISHLSLRLPAGASAQLDAFPSHECFEWTTTREDLIELSFPDDGEGGGGAGRCARSVTVTAKRVGGAHGAKVIAHASGGATLRCDVFLDAVDRISITRTQTKLGVGCERVIGVVARDTSGNTFSSLEGLPFAWSAVAADQQGVASSAAAAARGGGACTPRSGQACTAVKPLMLQDSKQKSSARRKAMEGGEEGGAVLQTDQIVMWAVEAGSVTMSVSLDNTTQPGLWLQNGTVKPAAVRVDVVEPLQLDPEEQVMVVEGACFAYQLSKQRECGDQQLAIQMPDNQYSWESADRSVAGVHREWGAVTALGLGRTTVTVRDDSASHGNDGVGAVVVVEARSIDVGLRDARGQPIAGLTPDYDDALHLVAEQRYNFHGLLFSQLSSDRAARQRPIFVTENVDVAPQLADGVEWNKQASDHRSLSVTFHSLGKTTVTVAFSGAKACASALGATAGAENAHYTAHEAAALAKPLTMQRTVYVQPPVRISLPWDELVLPRPEDLPKPNVHPLGATGGSGVYLWRTNDTSVVTVNRTDGRVTALKEGVATVFVVDQWNADNGDSRAVIVSRIASIGMARAPKEAQTGELLTVGAVLVDPAGRQFDSCFPAQFNVRVADRTIFTVDRKASTTAAAVVAAFPDPATDETVVGTSTKCKRKKMGQVLRKACFIAELRAHAEGESEVSLLTSSVVNMEQLDATESYGGFAPLDVLTPSTSKAVAAIGCSSSLSFRGGPRWLSPQEVVIVRPESHASNVHVLEVDARSATRKYLATCSGLGEQIMAVRVGNALTCAQRVRYAPIVKEVSVELKCAIPRSIEVAPIGHHGQLQGERELWQNQGSPSESSEAVRMCSGVAHAIGVVAYTGVGRTGDVFTNASSLELKWDVRSKDGRIEHKAGAEWGQVTIESAAELETIDVSVSSPGYSPWLVDTPDSQVGQEESRLDGLADSLPLLFLRAVQFNRTDAFTMFAHPENSIGLHTHGGSSLFDFVVSDESLATAHYVKPRDPTAPWARPAVMVSLHTACEGTLFVTVNDAGTIGCAKQSLRIDLSHLYALGLAVPTQCELGQQLRATVLASTAQRNGEHFELEQTKLMGIKLSVGNATVTDLVKQQAGVFILAANCLGQSNLTVEAAPDLDTASCQNHASQSSKVDAEDSDADESSQLLASKVASAQVEVHTPLRCSPSSIDLVPLASAEIVCTGGPRSVTNRTYGISGSGVATVQRGVVTAAAVGTTIVTVVYTVQASALSPAVSATADVPVRVVALDAIRIRTDVDWLAPGSMATLHLEGSAGQTPISLASLQLQCQWSSEDTNIAALRAPLEPSGVAALGATLVAEAVGKSRVQVFCGSVTVGHLARNLSHEITFNVEEPLKLLGPSAMLLRPGSRGELLVNRPAAELRFRVLSAVSANSIEGEVSQIESPAESITVDTSGVTPLVVASAGAEMGLTAYLAVESLRHRGEVETFVVTVEVRKLHSVHWRFPATEKLPHNEIALGSTLELAVELSDHRGRNFAPLVVSETPLHYVVSHPGVAKLMPCSDDGRGVTVSGAALGSAVVRVVVGAGVTPPVQRCVADSFGDKGTGSKPDDVVPGQTAEEVSDYLQLAVVNVLAPSGVVHVGSATRFALVADAAAQYPALASAASFRWRSDMRHVLDVSEGSGHAHAGQQFDLEAEVYLQALSIDGSVAWQTRTTAFVSRIVKVTIGSSDTTLSDASGRDDLVPVYFYGRDRDGELHLLVNTHDELCMEDDMAEDSTGTSAGDKAALYAAACLDHRIKFECSSPDRAFVSAAAVVDHSTAPFTFCKLQYEDTQENFPGQLAVSIAAGDRAASYTTSAAASFEFVGAFDLRPAESVNLWPAQPNITVEVIRAARPISASVPDEAASWGLFATRNEDGTFLVGVGEPQWRSGFQMPPDQWDSVVTFNCAEIEQTQTLTVSSAAGHASHATVAASVWRAYLLWLDHQR
jgi:hypothetical protein